MPNDPTPITSARDLTRASQPVARRQHRWPVPEALQPFTDGLVEFTLQELTTGEINAAGRRANMNPIKVSFEMAQASITSINGEAVSLGAHTTQAAWEKLNPKARGLVLMAFEKVHSFDQEDAESFLKAGTTEE